MIFGLNTLKQMALNEIVYPHDLPAEWCIDYYSNEFSLLQLYLSDFPLINTSDEKNISSLAKCLETINNDLDDHYILFDVSELTARQQQQLFNIPAISDNYYAFINLALLQGEYLSELALTLQWGDLLQTADNGKILVDKSSCFCSIMGEQRLTPFELRKLIELLQKKARQRDCQQLLVTFPVQLSGVENCRNAILLESMMSVSPA